MTTDFESLQKALDNRPNPRDFPVSDFPAIGFRHQGVNMTAWKEADDKWFDNLLELFSVFQKTHENVDLKGLEQKAKTMRELSREEGMLTEQWFLHKVPDDTYENTEENKWVPVETVTTLLMKLFKELDEYKETCKILSDEKLMKSIREGRKKGSKSSPYKRGGLA